MPSHYTDLSPTAQALFSQLNDSLLDLEINYGLATLGGYFSKTKVKNVTYWYYRVEVNGVEQRVYLGPDSPRIQALIEQKNSASAKEANASVRRLVQSCYAAGCSPSLGPQFKLIKSLADQGIFHAGGMLAGSHAFAAFANLLGIKWKSAQLAMTMDVDFSHEGKNISVALPSDLKIDLSDAISKLEEGFVPRISSQSALLGSWVARKEQDYVIDFIAPQTSDSNDPFFFEPLGVSLQPLRFMEFSLENVNQTVIFDRQTAVKINLPDPARYAMHKLIVYVERKDQTKKMKDLQQAQALIEVLKEKRPHDLFDAWTDLRNRGPGWRRRSEQALIAMGEDLASWADNYQAKLEAAEKSAPAWARPTIV